MEKFLSALLILFIAATAQAADYANPIGMEFNKIESGAFTMGSPADEVGRSRKETPHEVTLTKDFFMQTTEVTQDQWVAIMGNNPSSFKSGSPDRPVESVSWVEVQDFIRELNRQGFGTYALPTEAQWEYAAKAGTTTAFANDGGNLTTRLRCHAFEPLVEMGWYCHNGSGRTHEVGQKKPNAWGLFDMHGNVREWVKDYYGEYPEGPVQDPQGASSGFERVIRGGSYDDYAYFCRSAMRLRYPENRSRNDLGFRLIMTEPPADYVPPSDPPVEPPADPEDPPELPANEGSVIIEVGQYDITITWEKVR